MLKLTITDQDGPVGGNTSELRLENRKLVLGRAPNDRCDLQDPDNVISYAHCQIDYTDAGYVLTDYSTNGTFLNGAKERMTAPRAIAEGDEIEIGRYRIRAELSNGDAALPAPSAAEASANRWTSAAHGTSPVSASSQDNRFQRYVDANRINWVTGMSAVAPASKEMAAGTARPASDTPPRSHAMPAEPVAGSDAAWIALLSGAGIAPADVTTPVPAAAAAAGALLRRLLGGLMLLLDARARAKEELGAEGTIVSLRDNNPLKFLRSADSALLALINPPESGNLDGAQAVDGAFKDLQAHQMAILVAIQESLRTTLSRFAPEAIAARANVGGLMATISPSLRDAACWRTYQKAFAGIATGSDDTFMESFAGTFREAYQKTTDELRRNAPG